MTHARERKNIYCLDASAFLTLSRTNDNIIEIPMSLWDHLKTLMVDGKIISHRIVFDEISSNNKNPDFITRWISDKKDYFLPRTDFQICEIPKIISKFPGLIDYKNEHEQADPWLIALAIEKSKENTLFDIIASVVVSQENPNSQQKIPAVCKCFGIRHLSLRNFFDEIGISTDILKK